MPPPLPVEDQPEIPVDGYLWTPGYWYWRNQGFFWIPGAWVRPPQTGFLWTPAFWVLAGTAFVFHPGHWGPTVGYYGGIDYGHGYLGNGYTGARWAAGALTYNSSVNRLSPAIRHTYSQAPPNPGPRNLANHSSGNGGSLPRSIIASAAPRVAAPAVAPSVPKASHPRPAKTPR
jgi:hypothetical protein